MTLISASLRSVVMGRAGNRCEYCKLGQESQVATFPVDHVIPVSDGGPTDAENLALACPRCNACKWTHQQAVDAESGQTVPLFNPRTQQWNEHFQWSAEDPTIVEARTDVGRACVALLELNAVPHLSIRRLLHALGLHPPQSE